MKKRILLMSTFVFAVFLISFSAIDTFGLQEKSISGPYLGQKPPGSTPEIFAPGIISTKNREAFLVTYPGGTELCYGLISMKNNHVATSIVTMRVKGESWTKPEPVFPSEEYVDAYLAIHPDGSRLFFQSDRPVDKSESDFTWNIWCADRVGETWGEPEPIGKPVNGRNHVSGPSVTRDGTMYCTLMEIGGPSDLYRSKYINGVYQEPERLPDNVNSVRQQFDSYIAPDESYLIFNAVLKDSYGGVDLYVSFREKTDKWSDPVNLGPAINTGDDESSATISPDGKYIFFGRMNGKNDLDIYWVNSNYLNKLKRNN